ncbi:MAG: S24 family peptidase [Gammaproteobacteria bacterium]|nr:S24 family peptidase [Gammaproteobacteria bacterium]
MSNSQPIHLFKQLPKWPNRAEPNAAEVSERLEPSACVEAEAFALQVLDTSMQPEFRKGCIILIDPSGRATDGSFVLARFDNGSEAVEDLLFRQLRSDADGGWVLKTLNPELPSDDRRCTLQEIIGVVVQRAGVRRSYHKRYDLD